MIALCIVAPPAAVLVCRKPFQFLFNLVLTLFGAVTVPFGVGVFFLLVAVMHALLVNSHHQEDQRQIRMIRALQERAR